MLRYEKLRCLAFWRGNRGSLAKMPDTTNIRRLRGTFRLRTRKYLDIDQSNWDFQFEALFIYILNYSRSGLFRAITDAYLGHCLYS